MSRGAASGPAGKKFFVFLAAIFLLAAGCNKTANQPASPSQGASISSSANQPEAILQTTSSPSKQVPTQSKPNSGGQPPAATSTAALGPIGMTQTVGNAGKPDYTPGYVIVTETVDGSTSNEPYNKVKDTATAFDLLSTTHQVTFKDYGSGMGEFVESIDGAIPDGKHFWEFYINGKSSNVGASSYTLKDGDKIEWKLSVINSSGD